jgi:hypothetical protein
MAIEERELLISRRAFPEAQKLLMGTPTNEPAQVLDVGWHSNDVDPEGGSSAVVREGAGLDEWFGKVLRVSSTVRTDRHVFVYVLGSRGVPADLSLSRRAFLALGLLSLDSLSCVVEVVE